MKWKLFSLFLLSLFIVGCSPDEFAGQVFKMTPVHSCTAYQDVYCEGDTKVTSSRFTDCSNDIQREDCAEICYGESCITYEEYSEIISPRFNSRDGSCSDDLPFECEDSSCAASANECPEDMYCIDNDEGAVFTVSSDLDSSASDGWEDSCDGTVLNEVVCAGVSPEVIEHDCAEDDSICVGGACVVPVECDSEAGSVCVSNIDSFSTACRVDHGSDMVIDGEDICAEEVDDVLVAGYCARCVYDEEPDPIDILATPCEDLEYGSDRVLFIKDMLPKHFGSTDKDSLVGERVNELTDVIINDRCAEKIMFTVLQTNWDNPLIASSYFDGGDVPALTEPFLANAPRPVSRHMTSVVDDITGICQGYDVNTRDLNCCYAYRELERYTVYNEFWWEPKEDGTECDFSEPGEGDGVCRDGYCVRKVVLLPRIRSLEDFHVGKVTEDTSVDCARMFENPEYHCVATMTEFSDLCSRNGESYEGGPACVTKQGAVGFCVRCNE